MPASAVPLPMLWASACRVWGKHAQVMVVTHAPQVAARANRHVRLLKSGDDTSVATSASELDDVQRREELARMLAGAEITDAARAGC